MVYKKVLFIFSIVIFSASIVLAQQPTSTPTPTPSPTPSPTPQKVLKLAAIEFKGLQRIKQDTLIEDTGLQIGQVITPEMVDEAAARLSDSGRFINLSYRFRSSGEQVFVTFEVEETKASPTPVVFDNFVWFTEEDLWLWIKKDVPTFDGTAPDGGDETERIRKSLERLLKEKKIEGRVEYTPFANTSGGNPKHIYSVKGVTLTPCRVRFAGAINIPEKDLVANSKDLLKGEYSKSFVEEFLDANLKPLYRKIGHLRAKFLDVNAKPADESVCSGIVVSVKVDEGAAYKWDGATWANNQSIASKDLDAAFGMTAGELADGTKIDKGFEALQKAYSRKGYLMVRFKAETDFDDDDKKISYHVNISEGVQFKMGTLTIKGLPDDVLPRLQEKWKLKTGDVYDDFYIKEFTDEALVKEASVIALIRNNPKIKMFATTKPDVKNAAVDVMIEFKEQ